MRIDKGRVQKKKKKKSGNFPTKGGEGLPISALFPTFFLFIFKHGLNHPEMQKKNSLLGDPPPSR